MDDQRRTELEAATFRHLLRHLQQHPDIQNIDLMLTADFCRNCLAKWYVEAAGESGMTLTESEARELIYGMPYAEWKSRHQLEATPEQLEAFAARQAADRSR